MTCGSIEQEGGKKKNNLAAYNKELNATVAKNSKDKKIKNMSDVRAEAKKGFAKISKYVLRAEIIKELVSFFIGPSIVIFDEISPIPPLTPNFLLLPSFMLMSRTDESLPP